MTNDRNPLQSYKILIFQIRSTQSSYSPIAFSLHFPIYQIPSKTTALYVRIVVKRIIQTRLLQPKSIESTSKLSKISFFSSTFPFSATYLFKYWSRSSWNYVACQLYSYLIFRDDQQTEVFNLKKIYTSYIYIWFSWKGKSTNRQNIIRRVFSWVFLFSLFVSLFFLGKIREIKGKPNARKRWIIQ